jgi:hypothetical protein
LLSILAKIQVPPNIRPITRPAWVTVATDTSSEDQVIFRPVRTFPAASFAVAESWRLWPTCTDPVGGVTTTVATDSTFGPVDPPSEQERVITRIGAKLRRLMVELLRRRSCFRAVRYE